MDTLTVFYSKSSGAIHTINSGKQDYSMFGDFANDYEGILDFIIVDYDSYFWDNRQHFIVDIDSKELLLKEMPVLKYRVK